MLYEYTVVMRNLYRGFLVRCCFCVREQHQGVPAQVATQNLAFMRVAAGLLVRSRPPPMAIWAQGQHQAA